MRKGRGAPALCFDKYKGNGTTEKMVVGGDVIVGSSEYPKKEANA
jgi:hypothetical protein